MSGAASELRSDWQAEACPTIGGQFRGEVRAAGESGSSLSGGLGGGNHHPRGGAWREGEGGFWRRAQGGGAWVGGGRGGVWFWGGGRVGARGGIGLVPRNP